MTTLAKTPINYADYLISEGGIFVDGYKNITAMSFHSPGVKCPCPCHYTSYNKATFPQHCKSKKHKKWLADLSGSHDLIIKESLSRVEEIKDLRIRLEKEERKNKRYEKTTSTFDKEKRELQDSHLSKIEELHAEIIQLKEAHEWEQTKVGVLRKRLADFEIWFKKGAEEIMEWEIPESEESYKL